MFVSIRIKVAKGTGDCLGNFIRQIGISFTESFRVVGFTLHNNNSVNLYEVETAFQFGSVLHDLNFVFKDEPEDDFFALDYYFQKELKFSDLSTDLVDVSFKDTPYLNTKLHKEDTPILSSPLLKDSRLTLYFRKSRGTHTIAENKQFLELKLSGIDNTLVNLGSNHSELVRCSYHVETREGDFDLLEISLDGIGESEVELYRKIVKYGVSLLESSVSV